MTGKPWCSSAGAAVAVAALGSTVGVTGCCSVGTCHGKGALARSGCAAAVSGAGAGVAEAWFSFRIQLGPISGLDSPLTVGGVGGSILGAGVGAAGSGVGAGVGAAATSGIAGGVGVVIGSIGATGVGLATTASGTGLGAGVAGVVSTPTGGVGGVLAQAGASVLATVGSGVVGTAAATGSGTTGSLTTGAEGSGMFGDASIGVAAAISGAIGALGVGELMDSIGLVVGTGATASVELAGLVVVGVGSTPIGLFEVGLLFSSGIKDLNCRF